MNAKFAEAKIINRGRGPESAGTRITVYDVMDHYKEGGHRDQITVLFRLSSRDIQAAIDYIEAHKEEVTADYEKILERHRNYTYPPEVQAKIDQCKGWAIRRLEEIRRQAQDKLCATDTTLNKWLLVHWIICGRLTICASPVGFNCLDGVCGIN